METLLREARCNDSNPLELAQIPFDFLSLINTEIISETNNIDNSSVVNDKSNNKRLWVALGRWLGLKREEGPLKRKHVKQHLRLKWGKLKHSLDIKNNKNFQSISQNATKIKTRREKAQHIVLARSDFRLLNKLVHDKLVHIHYISQPECVTDSSGCTLVHLGQIDINAVMLATNAINNYYFHTLNNSSHQSDNFKKNFAECFEAYTLNNLLPFTSSDTASTHNFNHQTCVNDLIQGLKPLSNSVNQFVRDHYQDLYMKLENLTWGPFASRLFGIFPMISINYNIISDYHWDENDNPNSLCFLVALGDFEGGELCFPELEIVVQLKLGQVVAFPSRLLLHGNLKFTKGIRHSVVYFVHNTFFHHLRDFNNVYKDFNDGIERDANGYIVPSIPRQNLNNALDQNNRIKVNNLNNSLKNSKKELKVKQATDQRRKHIGKNSYFTLLLFFYYYYFTKLQILIINFL
jgi:hypothetical protein